MRTLQSIAMGFVIIALYARVGDVDLLADPLGWVLVLVGACRLPASVSTRPLLYVGALALVVSVPITVPAVLDALAREDASLSWAADLPSFAFTALLLHQLGLAATTARDRGAATVLRLLVTATLVVAALPVLVFGAGWAALGEPAGAAAELLRLVVIVTLFVYARRAWAEPPVVEPAAPA